MQMRGRKLSVGGHPIGPWVAAGVDWLKILALSQAMGGSEWYEFLLCCIGTRDPNLVDDRTG